jgi:hypothetical protein
MVLKKALLIGINYSNTSYSLNGCINDVLDMSLFLKTTYPECKLFRILHDSQRISKYDRINNITTKKNILDAFSWVTSDLSEGDTIYVHYSGHGNTTRDYNNDEQTNIYTPNMDSLILSYYSGIVDVITDDDIRRYLVNNVPHGVKCIAVFDSCRNGSILDLRYSYRITNKAKVMREINVNHIETSGNVISISSCYDNQSAFEYINQYNTINGIGTWALIDTWRKCGKYFTLKKLILGMRQFFIENKYTQIPQLSTGKSIDINEVFIV